MSVNSFNTCFLLQKALLESESEWSTNKKVVDIKGSDVRRTIPKGLPYFAVEFPPQGGFAHVIEDDKLFPANFAQSVSFFVSIFFRIHV